MTGAAVDAPKRHLGRFLLVSVVATAALALVAAHMPPRVKLLGLFPLAVGAAAGGLIAEFAGRNGVRSRRLVVGTAAALGPLTFTEYAAETYRIWRDAREAEITAHLLAQPGGKAVLDRVRSEAPPASPTEAKFLAAYRDRMHPSPSEFVARYPVDRLKGLTKEPPSTLAISVWIGELVAGAAAVIATTVLLTRRPAAPSPETTP